jgi:hypothetical protein
MQSIGFDNNSEDQITQLQTILTGLGFNIEQDELSSHRAGPSTVRAVRRFQREQRLTIDEGFLLDATAARALGDIAARRASTTASQPSAVFLVEGVVADRKGVAIPNLGVLVYDQDLRSRQQLGASRTDQRGRYSVQYGPESFARAEKGYADLVVEIHSGGDRADKMLYTSEVIFNASPSLTYNVNLDAGAPPEYDRIAAVLAPLVTPDKVPLFELDELGPFTDISFLSGETGYAREQIADFATAQRIEQATKLDPVCFYALLRLDLWPDQALGQVKRTSDLGTRTKALIALFGKVSGGQLRESLRSAIDTNLIARSRERIEAFIAAFLAYAAQSTVTHPRLAVPKVVLDRLPGLSEHADAAADGFDFVARLRRDASVPEEVTDRIEGIVHFSSLSLNHPPLTAVMVDAIASLDDVRRCAAKSAADWMDILKKVPDDQLPAFIPKGSPDEQRKAYASFIDTRTRQAYPTMAMVGDGSRANGPALPGMEALERIVDKTPAFDLGEISVDRFVETKIMRETHSLDEREDIVAGLKPLQRLYRVAKDHTVIKALADAGLTSAHDVYRRGRDAVADIVAAGTGQPRRVGEAVYARASAVYSATLQIASESAALNSASTMPSLANDTDGGPVPLPNLAGLFDIGNDCACDDCRSVLSPAAYLADLLMYLENRKVQQPRSAKDVLLSRRPDLAWIDLNCDNAYVPLPYVDVCVEVLEDAIAPFEVTSRLSNTLQTSMPPAVSPGAVSAPVIAALAEANPPISIPASATVSEKMNNSWVLRDSTRTWRIVDLGADFALLTLRNTHGTPAEREVVPEYINQAAYTVMGGKTFPWQLPIDLYGTEVRESLAKIGIPRHELMRILRGPQAPNNPTNFSIAADTLGLSDAVATLLITPNPAAPYPNWGAASNNDAIASLSDVPAFLKAAGLHYDDLLRVLALRFPNPGGKLSIQHLDESCDLDQKRIQGLDAPALDRLHRFLRLARALGLPPSDVDLLVRAPAVGAGLSGQAGLIGIAEALRVRDKLGGIDVDALVALLGDMPTDGTFDEMFKPLKPSLYARLFLDPAVFHPIDPAFAVDQVIQPNPPEQIANHRPPILAALQLSSEDLDRLLALAKPGGQPFVGPELSLANLSALFRHTTLARALSLSIEDWCALTTLAKADPFSSPTDLLKMIRKVGRAVETPFETAAMRYLLAADRTITGVPTEADIATALDGLRTALQRVDSDADPSKIPSDRSGLVAAVASALLAIDSDPQRPARVSSIFEGSFVASAALSPAPANPPNLGAKAKQLPFTFAVDGNVLTLTYSGLMSAGHRTILKDPNQVGPIAGNAGYLDCIDQLFREARLSLQLLRTDFSAPLPVLPAGLAIPAALRTKFRYDAAHQLLRFHGIMTADELAKLNALSNDQAYQTAVKTLFDLPRNAPAADNTWLVEADLVFPPDPSNPPAPPPETAAQINDRIVRNLVTAVGKLTPPAVVARSHAAAVSFAMAVTGLERDATTSLLLGVSIGGHPLLDHFTDRIAFVNRAGPLTPSNVLLAYQSYDRLHRSGSICTGLGFKMREVDFVIAMAGTAQVLNFSDLPLSFAAGNPPPANIELLLDLCDLVNLDRRTRGKSVRLFEFMRNAHDHPGNVAAADFTKFAEDNLGWPKAMTAALLAPGGIDIAVPADLTLAVKWQRIAKAVAAIRKTFLAAKEAFALVGASPTITEASLARQGMRARFGKTGFAAAERPVQNKLRHLKRDALTAYLLSYQQPANPQPPNGRWINSGDVFAYYLIDPDMNACQMTSRIVQASATIQIFVQRARMGLEPEVSPFVSGDDKWDQWSWMKAYRLWEANRQVFLFPENWVEPGFRRDKSPAFKALEDELLQSDLNDDSVEDAFRNYIDRLDEVSNLDITGIYWDDGAGTGSGAVHVVGRTPGQEPRTYYYRKLSHPEDRWSAWSKIEIDLKNAPAVPFLYEKRLHLLWPEFREQKPETPSSIPIPVQGPKGYPDSASAPTNFEYGIGLSENRNGKWTPKKVSQSMIYGGEVTDDKKNDKKNWVYWFPIDLLPTGKPFYFIDDFGGEKKPMEFLGCRGYPELNYDSLRVAKTSFDRADLITSREIERLPQGDEKNDDLTIRGNWVLQGAQILQKTPGLFKITYPHHITSFDRIGSLAWVIWLGLFGGGVWRPVDRSGSVTTGTYAPWVYGDKTRNFFVEPISMQPNATEYNGSELLDLIKAEFAKVDPKDAIADLLMLDYALINDPNFRLRWSIFYHPLVCDFRGALLSGGIKGLMARKTQFLSKDFNFFDFYHPNPIVRPPFPVEDVDFSRRGAYSLYNWELFFHAPFLIATSLSKNLRFEEAMRWFQYIFDPNGGDGKDPKTGANLPTTDIRRFWITKPFFEHTVADYRAQRIDKLLRLLASQPGDPVDADARKELIDQITAWRADPFDAHLIASGRTVAYQKATVAKYVENLIAWGDSLFVDNALEKVLEAGSLYQFAKAIMGDKPELVPPVGEPPVKTFAEIDSHLDAFGNTLVELEDILPVLPPLGPPQNEAALPSLLYFCVPRNDKLLALWDLVDDRLDKFHRCLDLQGRPRVTSLFAPPIDPAQIMQALMGGAGLADLLSDLDMPLSPYRFQTYLQKANELIGDLKAFGAALLSALEKRDGEALALLRQSQEIAMLNAARAIKAALINDAEFTLASLETAQQMATVRNQYYTSREFMNAGETGAIALTGTSLVVQAAALAADTLGGVLAAIPDFQAGASGFGGSPHVTVKTGGLSFSKAMELAAKALSQSVGIIDKTAGIMSTIAGYQRRFEDWQLQKDVTAKEIEQYAAQIEGARIKIDNAKRELANHDLQIENAKAIDEFLRTKYAGLDLYQWQIGEISKTYLETYKLAYAYAKMSEQHYRFQFGYDTSNIVQFGAWDSLKKGLLAGERLQLDLRQLEKAYLDENRREFELVKHVSLATMAPASLLALRRVGRCEVELPEEMLDLDYPGHYFRRIKSVSISIPCVAGPNTTIACTLRLLSNSVRVNPTIGGGYARKMQNGIPLDDNRFREMRTPVSAIATSTGQNDAGLFELNFRDERYLPFEGAGAISRWAIELQTDGALRTLDYDTIADVVLHIRYTAREDLGDFKLKAIQNTKNQLKAVQGRIELRRVFRIPDDFPAAWTAFHHPAPGGTPTLSVDISAERFSSLVVGAKLKLNGVTLSGHSIDTADIYAQIGAPPLAATKVVTLTNVDNYFGASDLTPFGPTPLNAPLTWAFLFGKDPNSFDQFDPATIEDLYLIVSYTIE